MKGLVLAGGKGSRIRNMTNGENKCLLCVDGKSILFKNVENLCSLDAIDECVVVVGYSSNTVMNELGDSCCGKRIVYCHQSEQKGLINAIECAVDKLLGNDFFMILGDEFVLNNRYNEAIKRFYDEKVCCSVGVYETDSIEEVKKTYTIRFNNDNQMVDFEEKPECPYNNIVGTGNVLFSSEVLNFLESIPVNKTRGEKELVDLFNILVKKKKNVDWFTVGDLYINVNTEEDYKRLERVSCLQ